MSDENKKTETPETDSTKTENVEEKPDTEKAEAGTKDGEEKPENAEEKPDTEKAEAGENPDIEKDAEEKPEDAEAEFFASEQEKQQDEQEMAVGIDVMDQQSQYYGLPTSKTQEEVNKAWRRSKRIKKLTPFNTLLMLAVLGFVPWYIYNDRLDLGYFFSSSDPVELGNAEDYHFASSGETAKQQNFSDNTFVHIQGIPIRYVGIQMRDAALLPSSKKLVYQLMGSGIYITEPMENSKYASFLSSTSTTFGANEGISLIDIKGRMIQFDAGDKKKYTPIRDYYAENYGTVFCANMSKDERERKTRLLGKGGVTLQIMPDGAIIQGRTDTQATLTHVEPMRGRSAMVIGSDNTLLQTTDAGLSWTKLPMDNNASTMIYDRDNKKVLFAGRDGFVGDSSFQGAQEVRDITYTDPDLDDTNAPSMIAVGREGLIEIARPNGWLPAQIEESTHFNDVLQVGNTWFVAGSHNMLMAKSAPTLDDENIPWLRGVTPFAPNTEWLSLTHVPGYVIATGSKGALAKYDLSAAHPTWEAFEVDDVPGIDFTDDIRSATVSDDGKTWVGVGNKGAILVAKADETGKFAPVQRISSSYASYGVIRDMLAGNSVEQSLYEALQRHTDQDLYDVAYHDGTFYAVGSESLLMTSHDGLSWTKRELAPKHRLLRSIVFLDERHGVIGGEKGTMIVTADGGETWRSKDASTERSIYKIVTSRNFKGGYVYAGAYGLWGYCKSTDDRCILRSKTDTFHYRSIAMADAPQQTAYLNLVAVGDNAHVDHIYDAPQNAAKKLSLWQGHTGHVHDMFMANDELPLLPNSAQGRIGLISAGNGVMYRSLDGGYTFKPEETGSLLPLRNIVGTPDGAVIWAFDKAGNGFEDLRGLGKWHRLQTPDGKSFLNGAILGQYGYLIDEQCVYRRLIRGGDIERVTCMDDGSKLVDITADKQQVMLVRHVTPIVPNPNDQIADHAELPAYDQIALVIGDSVTLGPAEPLNFNLTDGESIVTPSIAAQAVRCNQTTSLFDPKNHLLFHPLIPPEKNIADVACINDKLTILTSERQTDNTSRIAASNVDSLWSINVGLDAADSKFMHASDGRWWVASSFPFILMSHDGKKWSWRRDRITDFHGVATAMNHAVAVGDYGTILISDNNGETWSEFKTSSQNTLRDVCLSSDGSFGIAVGDKGTVYKTQNDLRHWVKLKYTLDFDITSCTIAEGKDRFQVYIAGKGGAIYNAPNGDVSRLELIATEVAEDIYSLTTLETGEVLAVGGNYQDPNSICEEGFLVISEETPRDMWFSLIIALLLACFWGYTLYILVLSWRHRNDIED